MVDSTDLDAFCELTLDEVYRYALRLTGGDAARTADLTQGTYAALLRHVARYPGEPVGLPWLITCCRHRYLDVLKKRRRREHHQLRGWEASTTEPADRHDDVIEALGRLRPVERAAIDDLLAEMGFAPGTVLTGTDAADALAVLDRYRLERFRESPGCAATSTFGGTWVLADGSEPRPDTPPTHVDVTVLASAVIWADFDNGDWYHFDAATGTGRGVYRNEVTGSHRDRGTDG